MCTSILQGRCLKQTVNVLNFLFNKYDSLLGDYFTRMEFRNFFISRLLICSQTYLPSYLQIHTTPSPGENKLKYVMLIFENTISYFSVCNVIWPKESHVACVKLIILQNHRLDSLKHCISNLYKQVNLCFLVCCVLHVTCLPYHSLAS